LRRALCAAAALALVACASTAQAQRGQRGGMFGPMGGGGLMLLRMPEVQQELKMTPPQIEKLNAKQDEVRNAMQEAFQGAGGPGAFGNMSPEEREKLFAKVREIQSKAVADILDSTQQKRLRQLEIQMQGAAALNNPEVATALGITADQRTKIAAVQREAMEAQRAAMQGIDFRNMSDEDRQKLGARMQEARRQTEAKILALLTDAQRARFKEMQGAPFKFPEMRGFGFGGPGGPRPGGRRPGGAPPSGR